jgi:hypothetical protein
VCVCECRGREKERERGKDREIKVFVMRSRNLNQQHMRNAFVLYLLSWQVIVCVIQWLSDVVVLNEHLITW